MLKRCINKIKKDGVFDTIHVIWREFLAFYNRWIQFPLKLTYYLHLFRFIFFSNKPSKNKKRILGIWDYKCLPMSVGDPLLFVEALSILKLENNADAVDIAIIYDKDNPAGKSRRSNITKENAQDYFIDFLPLFSMSPYLGSVLQFNERKELDLYLKNNLEHYIVFPSINKHLGETYNYSDRGFSHIDMLSDFYEKYRYIPHIRIGEQNLSWAYSFYLEHLTKKQIPIVLSLKNTTHSTERNADLESWLGFIQRCKKDYPQIKFIQVGLRGEEFDEIRACSNVIIAKDFATTLFEDFALTRSAALYMGTISGISQPVQFSDQPFLIFNMEDSVMKRFNLISGKGFNFTTNQQKFFDATFEMNSDSLFSEFKKLFDSLDKEQWRQNVLKMAKDKSPHPSAKLLPK